MDSGAGANRSNQCQDFPRKFSENSDEAVLSPMADDDTSASLEPITPALKGEVVDIPFECDSPLTEAKRPTKISCFAFETIRKQDQVVSVDDGSPQTPRDAVFDPFALGPDKMMIAPLSKKYVDKMSTNVARNLKFDSSLELMGNRADVDDIESISDEEMFESVYNNLLEAIVLKQTEGLLGEISNIEWDSESCKTPTPHLNGIAETCPGAPMKPSANSRKIDLGLCRKLEF